MAVGMVVLGMVDIDLEVPVGCAGMVLVVALGALVLEADIAEQVLPQ